MVFVCYINIRRLQEGTEFFMHCFDVFLAGQRFNSVHRDGTLTRYLGYLEFKSFSPGHALISHFAIGYFNNNCSFICMTIKWINTYNQALQKQFRLL